MDILNIIILVLWFIIITLFLREIANPKQWTEKTTFSEIEYTRKRGYIIQKYIPLFSILLFVTVIKLFII